MSPLQFRRKPAVGVPSPETESLLEFALSIATARKDNRDGVQAQEQP
jgi:hypothetical protein